MRGSRYNEGMASIPLTKSMPKADMQAYEVYNLIGGDEGGAPQAFAELTRRFYEGIENDPVIRPMYPADLTEGRENLALFLMQYFGGPAAYAEKRGHPRLRMRHLPFSIGVAERDAWLRHMNAAIDVTPVFAPVADLMKAYFANAADFMRNKNEEQPQG